MAKDKKIRAVPPLILDPAIRTRVSEKIARKKIGRIFRLKRLELRLSQKQVAALVYVSPSYYSRFERGAVGIIYGYLDRLKTILRVDYFSERKLAKLTTDIFLYDLTHKSRKKKCSTELLNLSALNKLRNKPEVKTPTPPDCFSE